MTRLSVVLILVIGLLLSACGAQPAAPSAASEPAVPAQMSVTDLKTKLDAGTSLLLLDVRSPEEFTQDGHVAGATLIPLPELEGRLNEVPKDKPIACICRSGNRSKTACDLLTQRGYQATNVEGGMRAWAAEGLPME